jgi:hypothetical protein
MFPILGKFIIKRRSEVIIDKLNEKPKSSYQNMPSCDNGPP